MNRCDECKHWGRPVKGYGKCRKLRWVTAFWYGSHCEFFEPPAPPVVDEPEPEEPVSDLLEL